MINHIKAKVCVLGASYGGKTALINYFLGTGTQHVKNYHMTMGVDVKEKVVRIPDTKTAVHFFLLDFSGKQFYEDFVEKLSSEASMVFLVFDVTSESSLHDAEAFFEKLKQKNDGRAIPGVLFGNKTDLNSRRRVSPKTGHELATRLSLTYFEGSVKEQKGIEAPFFYLANEWYKRNIDKEEVLDSVNDNKSKEKESSIDASR